MSREIRPMRHRWTGGMVMLTAQNGRSAYSVVADVKATAYLRMAAGPGRS
jgi:hypothetical protein